MKREGAIKIILSVFLVIHLIAVLLFPNPYSLLNHFFAPLINPYGNQLGLNTTWQFFSPDPGSLRYLEYDVVIESEENIDVQRQTFPPQQDSSLWKANQARIFYYAVRMVSHSDSIGNYLIPYLCRKHPEATSIALKAVDKRIPSMAKARSQKAASFQELHQEMDIPEQEASCRKESEEEG